MFLPLGDEPNPRGIPWITYGLIATNVAVYLFLTLPLSTEQANPNNPVLLDYVRVLLDTLPQGISPTELVQQISAYELVVFDYGFRPVSPDLISLFTSMFLHAGFMHLAGNMLFLWIYGDNVEHRLGSVRFLAAYLATGVVATLFHSVFSFGSALPVIGASGAISGVLGFYFIWFPHNRVRVWVFFFPFIMNVIAFRARLVLGVYLLIDNVMPFLVTQGTGGGVAYGAHIGGFIGGLCCAWWMGRRDVSAAPQEYRRGPSVQSKSTPNTIAEAVAAGNFTESAPAYFRLRADQTRQLLLPEDSIAFGDWLARNGHPKAALILYQRHLRDYPLGPKASEAHLGAGLVQLQALGQATPAYQHLVEVFDHDPSPETRTVARQALNEIASRQKFKVH